MPNANKQFRKLIASRVKKTASNKPSKKGETKRLMQLQVAEFIQQYPKVRSVYDSKHYKTASNYLQAEELMHIVFCKWLSIYYPSVFFMHPKNESKAGWVEQARKKMMGVKSGVSDLLLMHEGKDCFWLELKTPKGRIQPSQKEFIELQRTLGNKAEFAKTLNECVQYVEEWLETCKEE